MERHTVTSGMPGYLLLARQDAMPCKSLSPKLLSRPADAGFGTSGPGAKGRVLAPPPIDGWRGERRGQLAVKVLHDRC